MNTSHSCCAAAFDALPVPAIDSGVTSGTESGSDERLDRTTAQEKALDGADASRTSLQKCDRRIDLPWRASGRAPRQQCRTTRCRGRCNTGLRRVPKAAKSIKTAETEHGY